MPRRLIYDGSRRALRRHLYPATRAVVEPGRVRWRKRSGDLELWRSRIWYSTRAVMLRSDCREVPARSRARRDGLQRRHVVARRSRAGTRAGVRIRATLAANVEIHQGPTAIP